MKILGTGTCQIIGVRLDPGEDLLGALRDIAKDAGISSGYFFGLGGLRKAVLGYFVGDRYVSKVFEGQLEVTSVTGNISELEGEVFVHAHLTLGRRDYTLVGGHALPGCIVDPTIELVIVSTKEFKLKRRRTGKFSPLI